MLKTLSYRCEIGLPEPLYKTAYVDSATLGVRLADSVAEPIRQFYVQYRPTGESLVALFNITYRFFILGGSLHFA